MKKLIEISKVIKETDDFKQWIEINPNTQMAITGGNLIEIPYTVKFQNKATGEISVTHKSKYATSIKDVPVQNADGTQVLDEHGNPVFVAEFEEYEKSQLGQGVIALIEDMFERIANNEPLIIKI